MSSIALVLGMMMQTTAPGPAPADIDLFCAGRGERIATVTDKVRDDSGKVVSRSRTGRYPFAGEIQVTIRDGAGQAMIPTEMLADDDARGWHELKKLSVTDRTIGGKIYFGWLYSPVFSIDRGTGAMTIDGSMSNFAGRCGRHGQYAVPRTAMRAPAARDRDAGPPPGAVVGAGYDSREQARRDAARTDARAEALKADLAFRLFNSSAAPIVDVMMISIDGRPSTSWLRPGERIAPRAFRPMKFGNPSRCEHDVQVTFAGGRMLHKLVDLCRKDTLYVDDHDIWAE